MKKVGVQKAKIRAALWLRLFIVSVLGGVVFSLQAETLTLEQQKAEFIRLVQSGQLEQAYQLAAALEAQLAGEPDFDMAYGRIALRVDQNDSAVFALERVVAVSITERPDQNRACRGVTRMGGGLCRKIVPCPTRHDRSELVQVGHGQPVEEVPAPLVGGRAGAVGIHGTDRGENLIGC